ncbi:MAG TPA: peroxiredoxin-like family protein [Terriglobales bacterium]|nr:peroxiredoxin-like family protein [Terriglobales bacterium]
MKWRSLEESAQVESRTLREIYAERKELITKYVPPDIQTIHARVVTELQQSGIAERALQPGSRAPEFELPDHNGKTARASELVARGPLVVCFFRGRWCPFCVGQMEAMNAAYTDIQRLGASLVGISPQTVHQSYLMADQHRLRFPLLSDNANAVARQFGLVYPVPEYQREIYGRAFVNLPFVNGCSGWELPIPAVFILGRGPHSAVVYASANPDYTDRPEPAEILEALSRT